MTSTPEQLKAIGARLERAHEILCEARMIAEEKGSSADKAGLDQALQIGAKLGIYYGLLEDGTETDTSPLQEMEEFCAAAEAIGNRLSIQVTE